MRHAATERKQFFSRIAVPFVLFDSVLHGLLGKAVFQLERSDGQAVYEQAQIQRQLRVVGAVAQLTGYAEAVLLIAFPGSQIFRRRYSVKQVNIMRTMLYAAAQRMDRALAGDNAFKAGQKLSAGWIFVMQIERRGNFGLRFLQEGG